MLDRGRYLVPCAFCGCGPCLEERACHIAVALVPTPTGYQCGAKSRASVLYCGLHVGRSGTPQWLSTDACPVPRPCVLHVCIPTAPPRAAFPTVQSLAYMPPLPEPDRPCLGCRYMALVESDAQGAKKAKLEVNAQQALQA